MVCFDFGVGNVFSFIERVRCYAGFKWGMIERNYILELGFGIELELGFRKKLRIFFV